MLPQNNNFLFLNLYNSISESLVVSKGQTFTVKEQVRVPVIKDGGKGFDCCHFDNVGQASVFELQFPVGVTQFEFNLRTYQSSLVL